MTSPGWAAMLRVAVIFSAALGVAGCQRERTQTLAEAALRDTATVKSAELLEHYFPESPPKPDNRQLGTDLRILAPTGYFDRYERVDLARDRIPDDVQLYVPNARSGFAPVSRASVAKASPGQEFYAYRRAPGIDRFEKDYGISVAIAHFTEEEWRITGVGAARTQDFDLVFGPRGMLPVLLDKDNLAPFDVESLSRFALPRIYIDQTLGHLPDDTDLDFCIPYFRSSIGIGRNAQVVAGIPRTWADGFESERIELYWHRVLLRRDPFVLFSAAILYQRSLPPDKRQRAQESTRQLLEQVNALAAAPLSAGKKSAELQRLRQKFAGGAQAAQQTDGNEFALHTATFTSVQKEEFVARHYREVTAAAGADDPRFDSDEVVLAAAGLLKRLLVFGAEFYDERVDQTRLGTSDWAYLIGTSARPFVRLADDPRYGFSLPAPKSPVELDVFIMPSNRDELSRRTSQFFVDYLLIPEVAASMTTFARRATMVRESVAFLPAEITNSPIYSMPEPQSIVYLPILAGDVERLRRVWRDVLDFRDSIRVMDDADGTRHDKLAWRE